MNTTTTQINKALDTTTTIDQAWTQLQSTWMSDFIWTMTEHKKYSKLNWKEWQELIDNSKWPAELKQIATAELDQMELTATDPKRFDETVSSEDVVDKWPKWAGLR
jgi:hypothetical protein